ncbi:MAG: hypothetical protein K8E24_015360 [Methanobacterium paludis]|nr:hypothetical protein [Methanobacterium paludis]
MALLSVDASDFAEKAEYNKMLVNIYTEIAADEIAENVEKDTYPYVPFKLGYLEGGFTTQVLSYPPILSMTMQYSAIANNGYDYALIQHEEIMHHPVRKPGIMPMDHYMTRGINETPGVAIFEKQILMALG